MTNDQLELLLKAQLSRTTNWFF